MQYSHTGEEPHGHIMSPGGGSAVFKNDVIVRSCPKAVSRGSNTTCECTIGKLVTCLSQENGLHGIPSQISRMGFGH